METRDDASHGAPGSKGAGEDGTEGSASTNWGAWQETLRAVGPYLGFGFEVAATLLFFAGGGLLLDRWLGTGPWLTAIGGVVGVVGVVVLIRRVGGTLDRDTGRSSASEEER